MKRQRINKIALITLLGVAALPLTCANSPIGVNAQGEQYKTYNNVINFNHTEKDGTHLTELNCDINLSLDYRYYDETLYITNLNLNYVASAYDNTINLVNRYNYQAPLNGSVLQISLDEMNTFYLDLYCSINTELTDCLIGIDFPNRQSGTNAFYAWDDGLEYELWFNYEPELWRESGFKAYILNEINTINIARNEGYNDGKRDGYNLGTSETIDKNGFSVLLNSIFSAPAYLFGTMFNFEIFGINVKSIVLLLLTIGLVILAINVFKSKE